MQVLKYILVFNVCLFSILYLLYISINKFISMPLYTSLTIDSKWINSNDHVRPAIVQIFVSLYIRNLIDNFCFSVLILMGICLLKLYKNISITRMYLSHTVVWFSARVTACRRKIYSLKIFLWDYIISHNDQVY